VDSPFEGGLRGMFKSVKVGEVGKVGFPL